MPPQEKVIERPVKPAATQPAQSNNAAPAGPLPKSQAMIDAGSIANSVSGELGKMGLDERTAAALINQAGAQAGLAGIQGQIAKQLFPFERDLKMAQARKETAGAINEEYKIPENRLNSRINTYLNQGLDKMEGLVPLRNEITSLKEQAANLRAAGNEEMAQQFESVAAFKLQQFQNTEKEKFRSLNSAVDIMMDMMGGMADKMVPGAGNLYGIRDNSPKPPTRRIVPEQ